jgi:hypothetical protein
MKIIQKFLVILAIGVILFPIFRIVARLFRKPFISLNNYYFVVILLVLGVVMYSERVAKKSSPNQ